MTGTDLPRVRTPIPGPASAAWVDRLAARECPAITARRARRASESGVAHDPIVWESALGANVRDVDGNVFVDLTAGFGVAAVGHANPQVVEAVSRQAGVLPHAMGDAFADPRRVELMEALCSRTGMDRVILGLSGSDAVDAALKTAFLRTGRKRVLGLRGGYHGLATGSLGVLGYNAPAMRDPFAHNVVVHDTIDVGAALPDLRPYAAVILEPVLGRGGMKRLPAPWLGELHAAARAAGALVIHDEIYSGCGRTGHFLAATDPPDLLCLGKALGGGFPVSACLGTADAMAGWGSSTGAAIHTQTFLGHPPACAAALATLPLLQALLPTVRATGSQLSTRLRAVPGVHEVTGDGLMLGVVVSDALVVTRKLLERGYIVLPCGERAEALGITPPYVVTDPQLDAFAGALAEVLA